MERNLVYHQAFLRHREDARLYVSMV